MSGNSRLSCFASFLGKKVSVVIALFLAQARFQCKVRQLREERAAGVALPAAEIILSQGDVYWSGKLHSLS